MIVVTMNTKRFDTSILISLGLKLFILMFGFIGLLRKPHPFIYNLSSILIPGIISFLVIVLLAPLSFKELPVLSRFIWGLVFGAIGSFGVIMVVNIMKKLAPVFMKEENWTVFKELILIFLVIGAICLLNFVLIYSLGLTELNSSALFRVVVLTTLVISFFPVIIMVLFEQYVHQKKQAEQVKQLKEELKKSTSAIRESVHAKQKNQTAQIVSFNAENGKTELQLLSEEILYLKSDGNYVEVYYKEAGDAIRKKLIRNRLKNFSAILPEALFFDCHKSYVVNVEHIIRIEGNARNIELILRGADKRIPVSRSKSESLRSLLASV